MSLDDAQLRDVRRAGLVKRRLLGGCRVTLKGTRYVRDDVARRDEVVRAKLSGYAEQWESGAMTKGERREALVELVLLAWQRDEAHEAEALAALRSSGYDPLEVEALRRGEKRE